MFTQAKKHGIVLLIVSLLLVTLTGCGGSKSDATKDGAKEAAKEDNKEPIKIGVIAPLTGGSADMGVPVERSARLAFDEINAAGGINGHKVELVVVDDEADPAKGATSATRLIERDNVVAILGPSNTAVALSVVKVTQENKIPEIIPIAQTPKIMQPINPFTFRATETFIDDAQAIVNYMKESGFKRPAILYDSTASGLGGREAITPMVQKAGIPFVAEATHDVGAKDYSGQIVTIKKANPDVIITWSLGPEVAQFMKGVRSSGWNVPVIGHRGLAFPVLIELGGSAVEGMVLSDAIDETKPNTKEFLDKYEKAYNVRPDQNAFAALAYDGAQVLIEALKKANEYTPAAIRDAIESIDRYEPVAGKQGSYISFAPDKHEGPTGDFVVMREVKGGKYVTYIKK